MSKFFLTLIFMSFTAHASKTGFDRGNGGDILICNKGPGFSYEFFDHFEARQRGWKILVNDMTQDEVVEFALNRLEKINPSRVAVLRSYYATFFNELTPTKPGNKLIDIPDTGLTQVPRECVIQQLIVQGEPVLPGETRYTLDEGFYNLLSPADQGIMIFHELLYRNFLEENKATNVTSRFVRYLVGSLISNHFDDYIDDVDVFTGLVDMLNFQSTESYPVLGKTYPIYIPYDHKEKMKMDGGSLYKNFSSEIDYTFDFEGLVVHQLISFSMTPERKLKGIQGKFLKDTLYTFSDGSQYELSFPLPANSRPEIWISYFNDMKIKEIRFFGGRFSNSRFVCDKSLDTRTSSDFTITFDEKTGKAIKFLGRGGNGEEICKKL